MANPISAFLLSFFGRMMPTFEDIRKALAFWIDQEGKYFYFETPSEEAGERSFDEAVLHFQPELMRDISVTRFRIQERIVGKIVDALSFPPSLLLTDVTVNTVEITLVAGSRPGHKSLDTKHQDTYGLVMHRIHYYERISPRDPEEFMSEDPRWT